MFGANNTGEPQDVHQRVGFVVGHRFAVADPDVEAEQTCQVRLAPQHSFPDEDQVVVPVPRPVAEKEILTEPVHVALPIGPEIARQLLAESLGQIGMAARPVQHTV